MQAILLKTPSHSVRLTREQARSFVLRATGLSAPFQNLEEALEHLSYVQLDPLNVCGRMHDLVLRNRVFGYTPGEVLRRIHGVDRAERFGFEHYIPGHGILVAWTRAAHPFIAAHLARSPATGSRRTFSPSERKMGDWILEQLRVRGPLQSDQIEHDERSMTVWGTPGRLVKVVLEKLFACGEVLIRERKDFRRVYDLAERVLPPLRAGALPSDEELRQWMALTLLRQRRLVRLRRNDVALMSNEAVAIEVDGVGEVYGLREDVPLLEAIKGGSDGFDGVRLLAPLDPVIYDRKLTSKLWDFDFTWEVYTPPKLRRRGYYSLPVLRGLELVGDVEPRFDWKEKRISVISRRLRRGVSAREPVRELGDFLAAKKTG